MSNTSMTKMGGILLAKKSSKFISILLVFVILLGLPLSAWAADTESSELLQEARQLIFEEFVRPVDKSVLNKSTIEDMVKSLDDPYSVYYTPDEYKDFLENTDQVFSGVGLQVDQVGDYVVVVAPLKNTPAQKAGIKSGDKVLAVDGEDVVGKGLDYVVSKIRGEAGTSVVLTLEREGVAEPLDFLLTREKIQLDVVEYEMLENDLGYIHLTTFSRQAGKEFEKAVTVLKAKGMKGLIFDLRQNPGGYLSSALDIAADFAAKGEVLLHVAGRDGVKDSYESLSDALNLPTVVLVDGGSASASEIVAGAIQDLEKGILVGTQTFGKASVQTVFGLSNGGALKLTTAKYMTPDERIINGIGLTPDYIVEDYEAQLAKAIELLEAELGIEAKKELPSLIVLNLHSDVAKVNEKEVALGAKPLTFNNRVLVPGRFIAEALGTQMSWDGDRQAATFTYKDKNILLTPGQKSMVVNGETLKLEVPPQLVEGRIFVPLRFVCEAFGAHVSFSKVIKLIQIEL